MSFGLERCRKLYSRLVGVIPNKAISSLALTNTVANGLTFVLLLWLSKMLDPSEYGSLTLAISVLMQITFLVDFGTGLTLVRWYNSTENSEERDSYCHSVIAIRACITVLILLSLYPLSSIININLLGGIYDGGEIAVIAVVSGVVMSWWNFFRSLNNAKRNYRNYSRNMLILSALRVILLVLTIQNFEQNSLVKYAIIVLYIVCPLMLVVAEILSAFKGFAFSTLKFSASVIKIKQMLGYSRWLLISTILFPLSNNIPLWVLGHSNALEAAGAMGVGIYFANAITPIKEALKMYLLPKVVGMDSVDRVQIYYDSLLRKLWLAIPLAIIASLGGVVLQALLNGDKYEHANIVVIILVASNVITMFTSLFGAIPHYLNRPEMDAFVNVVRVLLSAIMAIFFVEKYGVMAAVMVTASVVVLGEIVLIIWIKRELKKLNNVDART